MSMVPLAPELSQPLPPVRENEGLLSYLASVDHKKIGLMYLTATFIFFILGGLEALLLRVQLAHANNRFLTPAVYDEIFTMHGITMIFLVVMPMLIGFAMYLVPLQIGARDVAFPRLNAFGFWVFVFGGVMLYYSFITSGAPDDGWFAYAPLTEKAFSPGEGMDYYCLGLITTGLGTVASGINLIVTIFTMRAPGLTMRRLPLFTWMVMVNSFLIIWALPSLNASLVELWVDRQFSAHFFDPTHGGSALLWQHDFWSFGHPEVYIMILPAWGMISEVIPVFSRKPIWGYSFVAAATIGVGVLSLAVWAHHMFTTGMGRWQELTFSFSSMAIAVPTGIKVFNWTATLYKGAIRFTTSMLFALAFIIQFTLGGLTGVSFAVVPIDWQMEDSYYVVAHFHYVLFGGTVFAVLAGVYYWFPKVTGRMLNETWGKWHFWLSFVGFNVTFFPMHILGILGMPRRVWTYPDREFWTGLNFVETIGSFILGFAVLIFVINIYISIKRGRVAGDNPWEAWTLEWATSSPPPTHNFDRVPPVRSRRPLYDLMHPDHPDWKNPKAKRGI